MTDTLQIFDKWSRNGKEVRIIDIGRGVTLLGKDNKIEHYRNHEVFIKNHTLVYRRDTIND